MPDTSFLALLLRLAVSLGVVLLLMAGAARLLGRTPRRLHRGGGVEMLSRQSLGRRSSVATLRVGGKAFLVGVTDTNVSVLAELDPAELTAPVEKGPAETTPPPQRPWALAGREGGRPMTFAHLVEQLRERTVRKRVQ